MSINTQVFIEVNEGDFADIPDLEQRIVSFLDANGYSVHVLKDIEQLLAAYPLSPIMFALSADALIDLFSAIAQAGPELEFWVRGIGELGAGDTWVREFSGGRIVFEAGPFPDRMNG